MKRISGTYFDHLWSIIIYGVLFGWLVFIIRDISFALWLVIMLACILLIWAGVILKIRFTGKVNSTLYVDETKKLLKFDNLEVSPDQIECISVYEQWAQRYNLVYIDFLVNHNQNKVKLRIQNMVAMTLIDMKWDYPKSLQILINMIPELEGKIKEEN